MSVEAKLELLTERYHALEEEVRKNTAITMEIADILNGAKAFFRLAEGFSKALRWAAVTAAAGVALWKLYKERF